MANFLADYMLVRIADLPQNSAQTDNTLTAPRSIEVEWVRCTAGAYGVAVSGNLSALAQAILHDDAAPSVPVYVLLPARLVVCVKVKLPTRNVHQMTQALPFVVEEQLSDDIELYHLVPDLAHSDGEKVLVQTMPVKVIDVLLQQLSQVGIAPAGMYSEGAWLPSSPHQLTVMVNDGDLVLNHNGYHFACDSDNADFMVPALLESSGVITSLTCYNMRPEHAVSQSAVSALALQAAAGGVTFNEVKITTQGLAGLLECATEIPPSNLLYGRFAARDTNTRASRWRKIALSAAAILLMLQLVFDLGAGTYFGYEADQARDSAEKIFRSLFPDEKRITNLRSQMQARLSMQAGMSESGSFAYLFGLTAGFVHTAQGADLKITDVRYDARRQELLLGIDAKSIDGLEKCKTYLRDKGLNVSITSANEDDGIIKGRLQIVSGDKL